MQTRYSSFCLLVGMIACAASWVQADIAPGVDSYVQNAELLLLVHAQSNQEREAFPPANGKKRLVVEKVLKGFTTHPYVDEAAPQLKDGQSALVLYQYAYPDHYRPALRTASPKASSVVIWPIGDKDHVMAGNIHLKSGSYKGMDFSPPSTLADVINYVAEQTPEEVGLCDQSTSLLLALPGGEAMKDPKRKSFVEYYTIVRDLGRDVHVLAGLLESTNPVTRAAAKQRLEAIASGAVPNPKDEDPLSLQLWSHHWMRWWNENEPHLFWNETLQRWVEGDKDAHKRRWPPIPAALKLPRDEFPPNMVKALEQKKSRDFAPAFRDWLDSGVMRDRQICMAASLDRKWVEQNNLDGAIGGSRYLPPAPRLSPEVIFSDKISATDRMKAFALVSHCWHYGRFTRERARAIVEIEKAPMDAECIKRAAFWEMTDDNFKTSGRVAGERFFQSKESEAGKLSLALFLIGPTSETISAARQRIESKDKEFIKGLLQHVRSDRDGAAEWAGRLLCQSKHPEIIPILLEWLGDSDPHSRQMAALNLCWFPSADAIPGLLHALKSEKIPAVEEQFIVALAQTGDRRALDPLLAAAREKQESYTAIEIARGLSRIKDAHALPALAEMATRFKGDDQASWEIVNAFGYISGEFKGYSPSDFCSGSAIEMDKLKDGQSAIKKWMKKKSDS